MAKTEVALITSWWIYAIADTIKEAITTIWDDLPGPWWAKIIILALVFVLTQVIPGQFDDVIVWKALHKACRAYAAWKESRS